MSDTERFNSGAWGDLGGGYYRNPVLMADFSDPDVIRVGEDFYMVCSEFHYMGMPVLHSNDLVNWTIIGQVYDRLDIDPRYDRMDGYGAGSWAPAIRYHNGLFYVYFCTPNEGLYMSTARDPSGPWSPLHEVKRVSAWEDPCPFWDDDGNAYLGRSITGAGPIVIHRMSLDGKRLLDEGVIVYVGKTAEGTKIYKKDGYYYLIIPEGGVSTGWQTALRSKSIYGPYERRVVLQQGRTEINGPHQGGLVDTPSGEWWFMHFQSSGAKGRVCHLQPVQWVDGWPIMGSDCEPVSVFRKPEVSTKRVEVLQTSDDFSSTKLGLQWQWNHNPVDDHWSLTERPGYLRIRAMKACGIRTARNTVTQKLIGNKGVITVELSIAGMATGQQAGLTYLGADFDNWIGVEKDDSGVRISSVTAGTHCHGPAVDCDTVWLRTQYDFEGSTLMYFSVDGIRFWQLGGECQLAFGFWKGARVGLFTYNKSCDGGIADFARFTYEHDGPSMQE